MAHTGTGFRTVSNSSINSRLKQAIVLASCILLGMLISIIANA